MTVVGKLVSKFEALEMPMLAQKFSKEFRCYSDHLTAFAVGIFLHVSTTILYESSHNHRYNFAKLAIVILGMVLAYVSLSLL